jgi:hypothetical protein
MVLFWPVGGAKYRLSCHQRFAEHLGFVQQNGLEAVVSLVKSSGKSFSAEPRGGPWTAVIRNDAAFADAYAKQDVENTKSLSRAWRARCSTAIRRRAPSRKI